jgi:hypothetical protein
VLCGRQVAGHARDTKWSTMQTGCFISYATWLGSKAQRKPVGYQLPGRVAVVGVDVFRSALLDGEDAGRLVFRRGGERGFHGVGAHDQGKLLEVGGRQARRSRRSAPPLVVAALGDHGRPAADPHRGRGLVYVGRKHAVEVITKSVALEVASTTASACANARPTWSRKARSAAVCSTPWTRQQLGSDAPGPRSAS